MAKHPRSHTSKHPKGSVKAKPTAKSNEEPVFAQPKPSPDPTTFKNPVTDQKDNRGR